MGKVTDRNVGLEVTERSVKSATVETVDDKQKKANITSQMERPTAYNRHRRVACRTSQAYPPVLVPAIMSK